MMRRGSWGTEARLPFYARMSFLLLEPMMLRSRDRVLGVWILRYVVVGASVNGAGYLAYLTLTWVGLSPRVAVTLLLPMSLWAAFQMHARVTFSGSRRNRATALRFLAVALTGYTLNLGLLTALVDGAGIPHQLAQLVSMGLIALVMFRLMRQAVFPDRRADHPAG